MASSDNLASLEPWTFRTFTDSWVSDAFLRDTETLTKALQKSLSNDSDTLTVAGDTNSAASIFNLIKPETVPTPTGSGSEPEMATKRRNTAPAATGKISKRKSRASKRSPTTFITADPANFRQMVQQVTGVRFGNSPVPGPILKPEPQRPGTRLQGCLPTLDTSAFLLDHHQQQNQMVGPTSMPQAHVSFAPVANGSTGLDFDAFQSFPTLESWRVM